MRLIDIEPIVKKWSCGFDGGAFAVTLDLLEAPIVNPLDVLGICQCKDCAHFRHNVENEPYCINKYGLSNPKETDYCSYAERKE